nr:hypothetical protein [Tanacetum cinerariifolium]
MQLHKLFQLAYDYILNEKGGPKEDESIMSYQSQRVSVWEGAEVVHLQAKRNKVDLDTMTIDDLYNNFKIVKQEVKRTVTTSSSSGSQNMAFLSSPGSANEVDTANIQVSVVSSPISTVSTHDNTANLSDATVELVERSLSIGVILLVMTRQRLRNQDSSRKTVNVEDTSSKAMVAINEAGFDWIYMADDEGPTHMALMAFSNLETKVRPVWNNAMRNNHQNFSNSIRNFAPTAILTKSGIVPICTARQSSSRAAPPVSAARPINTVAPKPLVNVAKPRQNALHNSHSLSMRPFYQQTAPKNRNSNNKVNTAKEHDGGYVAFSEGAKGGNITGKRHNNNSYAGRASPVQAIECLDTGGFTSWKRAIGTKWVCRNKRDQRGIAVKNKARLVAQGHRQEEGINYNDVFAPVARTETIRLFLAYASFMDFIVYQMDVKSAFLYGTIKEEVYVSQPPGFVDLEFPDRVYKVEKALYRLHLLEPDDIIFGSTKRSLSTEFEQLMHKRFQMSFIRELTFFLGLQCKVSKYSHGETKPLSKDAARTDVDVHLYRSMIGSLMYLTSSRRDIMFAVCACSRFQVQPKVSHMHAVKRIFRYLKAQPTLGLWYPKDSPLELIAYSDSDYTCASLDRKSTTRGCQHVLWLQNQLLDYGYNFMQTKNHVDNESVVCMVKNHVYYSNTKHIEIRHHFIRDSYEKRLIEMVKIHTDYNVADLLTKAFDVTRFQFFIASIGLELKGYLINDGYADLVQLADKKELAIPRQMVTGKESSNPLMAGSFPKTISAKETLILSSPNLNPEPFSSIINFMADLKFVDQHNIVAYLEKSDDNTEFHQIVDFLSSCSINYALTVSPTIYASYIEQFWNTASSKTINFVKQIHAIVDGKAVVISESLVRSDLLFDDEHGITCLTNDEIFENHALMGYEPLSTKLAFQKGGSPRRQETIGGTSAQTRSERVLEQPNEPPLTEGYTRGSDEGMLTLEDLMDLCTILSNRISTLENELLSTKVVYHKAFITLTKGVKKLETQLKKKRSRAVIHSSNEEEPSVDIEDSPKHGRMIKELDKDEDVNLGGYKQSYFKGMKYEDIRPIFERKLDQQTEKEEKEVEAQVDSDQEQIDAIPLTTKPPVIVEYKIVKEGRIRSTVGNNEKKGYFRSLPYYNKCKLHHKGKCTIKCTNCKKVGHMARDCRAAVVATAQRALVVNQRVVTYFGCGGQGHYKSDCTKLKYQNHGKKAANNDAHRRAYALGGGDGNPDSNVVTGTFLLNNRYAYILFDSGTDRSFVSTTFSDLIDITPTALDVSYTVELANGRIVGFDTIIRGYRLSKYHVVIVCDKNIVRIPYGDETLKIQGDESNGGSNSRLNIILCAKTQKYIKKGSHVFLAHVSAKKTKDKSKEERLEDVPIV